jgi:hypothetical protein
MVGDARFVAKRNLKAFVDGIKRDALPFEHVANKVYDSTPCCNAGLILFWSTTYIFNYESQL